MSRSISLRLALPLMTTLLILVIGAGVGSLAVTLLRRLGDEQSIDRVGTAGNAALTAITQIAHDVDVSVRLLAERPTLQRYVESAELDGQRRFLRQFAATGGLDDCAVIRQPRGLPGENAALPWAAIAGAFAESGPGWSLVQVQDGGPPLIASSRPLAGSTGARVACMRRIDDALAAEVTRQIGVPVRILSLGEARARGGNAWAALLGAAADEGRQGAARIDAIDAFLDVRALSDPSGAVHAVVETRLDAAVVDGSVRRLQWALWSALAVAVSVIALGAFALARRMTAPLAALARASARIGAGELETPVPRSTGGEVAQLAATMEEMRSGLLRLTSELRQRHAELAAILDGIVEGVWAVDRARRITWMNEQAAERLGIRASDAIGRFCGDVLKPELLGGGRPCDTRCPIVDARSLGSARATEHLVLADGTRRTVVITSAPTAGDVAVGDRASSQFQVLREETELEGARRMRDALLANVTHEFRTPLSAQIASLEMLKERLDVGTDPDAMALVRSTERGTLRLMWLVDNLLESLRIESGGQSIRRREVALEEVLDESIEQTDPLVTQKGQTIDVNLPGAFPVVLADGPRLTQVFVNLLANASKFAPPGSRIAVGGAVTEGEIAIWVRDEGPGFPEDYEAILFAPFIRASSEEPAEIGMGLGLYIAHSIVKRHGGRLVVKNADSGAEVTVYLPRETNDEDPRG